MNVSPSKSKDVIDRRRGRLVAIGTAIVAGALGVCGIVRHQAADPESAAIALVSTATDRAQAFYAHHVAGYRNAQVILFRGSIWTLCGIGRASEGPFYCPREAHIYLDLGFLEAIPGDAARAYVVAHEFAHHVQAIRGDTSEGQVHELAADCLAGAWLATESVSVAELATATSEAAAVGDDRLRPGSSPETWSHGSSSERTAALQRGLTGGMTACER